MRLVSSFESDYAVLESIRRHLLGDCSPPIIAPANTLASGPVYRRNSSFNGLYPCLTENWGELPLKEDDSEDMVLYGILREAVHTGWSPEFGSGLPTPVTIKPDTVESPVTEGVSGGQASAAAPTRGKLYHRVTRRSWDESAAEIWDPVKNGAMPFVQQQQSSVPAPPSLSFPPMSPEIPMETIPDFTGELHEPRVMEIRGASWLTQGPNQQRSATKEESCGVSSCASNSSILKVATLTRAVDCEHLKECLDTLNIHGGSGPYTSKGVVRWSDHQVSTHGSGVGPSPLVVKGTYKGENFRIEFCYTPCVDELKKEVGEKLELAFGKFKLEFRDEDDDWIVLKDNSDLKHCLRLSRSSDSEIIKLKLLISDIVGK